ANANARSLNVVVRLAVVAPYQVRAGATHGICRSQSFAFVSLLPLVRDAPRFPLPVSRCIIPPDRNSDQPRPSSGACCGRPITTLQRLRSRDHLAASPPPAPRPPAPASATTPRLSAKPL